MPVGQNKLPKILRGQRIIDSLSDLKFEITPSDIKKAKAKDPLGCAAALALRRECHTTAVCVMRARTYIKRQNYWVRYITPVSLAREVIVIDRNGQFEPGNFKIKAPSLSQKLGQDRRQRVESGRHLRSKRTDPFHYTAKIREVK